MLAYIMRQPPMNEENEADGPYAVVGPRVYTYLDSCALGHNEHPRQLWPCASSVP